MRSRGLIPEARLPVRICGRMDLAQERLGMLGGWLIIEIKDWLRNSRVIHLSASFYNLIKGCTQVLRDNQVVARSIIWLCASARLARNITALKFIESRIKNRERMLDIRKVRWAEFVPHFLSPHILKAVILKPWISQREKGVLLVNFEDRYIQLLRLEDIRDFAARYTLIIGPSWHPPHSLLNYAFANFYPEPFFSLISNVKDRESLPGISSKFITLPLYNSNWVNPHLYHPQPRQQRDIDIIMVANCSTYKRHFALFKALQNMPSSLKVLLIATGWGRRTAEALCEEAKCYGVGQRFTLAQHLPYQRVADALCHSRISVILSRREGSCVAVTESMFADTPIAILENAQIGSRAFINESTGRLLKERNLAEQLLEFLEASNAGKYSPRKWAEANISCFQSSRILNDILKKHSLASGQKWTQDIAVVSFSENPVLALPEDCLRIRPEVEKIRERFGIIIGA